MNVILSNMLGNYPELKNLPIEKAYDLLLNTATKNGTILTCGNGGSAADAEHIVGELVKGFLLSRSLTAKEQSTFIDNDLSGETIASKLQHGIAAIALNSQTPLLTAVGNDTDFDMVFAQQVYVYGKEGDSLIAMSTSGNSKNVVNAAITAKSLNMHVIGITGSDAGTLGSLCDVCLCMPSDQTYRIQEYTLPVYHALCAMLEQELYGKQV